MAEYQIYTLHSGGLSLGSHTLRSETDDAARAECKRCLPEGGVAELWKNGQHIGLVWIGSDPESQAVN